MDNSNSIRNISLEASKLETPFILYIKDGLREDSGIYDMLKSAL